MRAEYYSKQNLPSLQCRTLSYENIQNSGCTIDAWDYEEYLDVVDYRPERNDFFDIWQHEVSIVLID